jgi:hypothetical protein
MAKVMSAKDRKNLIVSFGMVIAVCTVIGALIFSLRPLDYDLLKIEKVDNLKFGEVTKVDKCKTSKHNFRCRVTTTTHVFSNMDIQDLPNGELGEGDELYRQSVTYENGHIRVYFCVNKTCHWENTIE